MVRNLHEYEEIYGWKRPSTETMIGRLLALGLTQIDQYTLTKESLELVDKEYAEVRINSRVNSSAKFHLKL